MTSVRRKRTEQKPFAVVFGATGLVGRHLVTRLSERGFEGWCLSRGAAPQETPPGFLWNPAETNVPASATLFSLVPISALPASVARISGGARLIALSTSSVIFKAESSDPAERDAARNLRQAEERVRQLCRDRGICWTIFRPTLIYDPGRDRNVSAIASFVRRFGVFPIVRPGAGERQPIHADDVAQAMTAAVDAPGARNAILGLPGGETLTYREMVRRIFVSLGKRPVLLHLPPGLARASFHVWRRFTGANYSAASLERMNAPLTLDPLPAREALGIACRPFRPEFPESPRLRVRRPAAR